MKKYLLIPILLTGLLVAGCTTTIDTRTSAVTTSITKPTPPRPMNMQKISVKVYDREDLKKTIEDPNFRRMVGLSVEDYEKLLNNLDETIRYIETQKSVILYYEKVLLEIDKIDRSSSK